MALPRLAPSARFGLDLFPIQPLGDTGRFSYRCHQPWDIVAFSSRVASPEVAFSPRATERMMRATAPSRPPSDRRRTWITRRSASAKFLTFLVWRRGVTQNLSQNWID